MSDEVPVLIPDVLAGMLALTLGSAMQRLHNTHSVHMTGDWSAWTTCAVSTLCREAAALVESPEAQLAIEAAKVARGA
jgi:hypothetical protein